MLTLSQQSRPFFELQPSVKSALRPSIDSFEQGYTAVGEETSHGRPWHRESFGVGRPCDDDGGLWPDEELLPRFRKSAAAVYEVHQEQTGNDVVPTLTTRQQRMNVLSEAILKGVSMALGMEEAWLGEQHKGSLISLHLNHYPEVGRSFLETGGSDRSGAHLDLDTLTLFVQDSVGGLEVAHMSTTVKENSYEVGQTAVFVPVSPSQGTILVSGGHMLTRYTNGEWRGGVHRVSAPAGPAGAMCAQRFSLTFHVYPDTDVIVDAIEKYMVKKGSRKYKPIKAGDFLLKKRQQIYK